ncbi:hypothetical protein MTO96_045895 [Rhipicephalus appendiculatus]
MYNVAFYNESTWWKQQTENHSVTKKDLMKRYFEDLFKELQTYFHNQSIMVNIKVESVSEIDNLIAIYESQKFINATATLINIQNHGMAQGKSNDTVFYLFTWPDNTRIQKRLLDHIRTPGPHRSGVPGAHKTF